MSEKIPPNSPVFYDPRGRRWRNVRRTYLALGIAVTAITAVFIASVLANPLLPRLNLRPLQNLPQTYRIKPQPPPAILLNLREKQAKKAQDELKNAYKETPRVPGRRSELTPIVPAPMNTPLPAPASFNSKQLAIGFYINWDESSYASLERNLDHREAAASKLLRSGAMAKDPTGRVSAVFPRCEEVRAIQGRRRKESSPASASGSSCSATS